MTSDVQSGAGVALDQPKKKKKKIVSLDRRKARAGWIFVLPFIIGLVLIYLPMIYESVILSFQKVNFSDASVKFVGLENYQEALLGAEYGSEFAQTLVKGLKQLVFDVPAIIIFSLFMAVMLNQKMAGRGFFRAIFFIPVILSTGLMEGIAAADMNMGSMEGGIDDGSGVNAADQLVSSMDLQRLFSSMKVGTELVQYVAQMINDIYDIVNRSGVQMLIFLSSLQSISPAIYESCKIDGATAWETFWKVTFPMITPMILVNAVYTIIDSFTTDSNIVMTYIADTYSKANGQEISTAMSWIYFLIVILIVAIIASIISIFVFYQRKSE